jgi:hypothetical protein
MKYKRMGLMVCFSFMVDGFEDTWLFISIQKVELADFNKNLEGKNKQTSF